MFEESAEDRAILEETLWEVLERVCRHLRMGLADWDLNSRLRRAIRSHPDFPRIVHLVRWYDGGLELAKRSGIPIDQKFFALKGMLNR
jgi:hypothetical protein